MKNYTNTPEGNRIKAYRDCLLNTCVRMARTTYPDLLLSSCLENSDFVKNATQWLAYPLFSRPIEQQMETARFNLLNELVERSWGDF